MRRTHCFCVCPEARSAAPANRQRKGSRFGGVRDREDRRTAVQRRGRRRAGGQLPRRASQAASLTLPAVLLVDGETVTSDADALAAATVTAEVVSHSKGPKIKIHKFKNKTGTTSGRATASASPLSRSPASRAESRSRHGTQEGRLVLPQRSRLQRAAPRRQAVRRPGRQRRRDHRPPARHPLPPRRGVGRGKDDTLFALSAGAVQFGDKRGRKTISIVPTQL